MDEDLLEQQQGCAWDELVQSGEGPSGPIWRLKRQGLLALHPALQRRLLERLLCNAQGSASYEHIMALLRLAGRGDNGRELHLKGGLRAVVQRDLLCFSFPWGRGACRRSCKKRAGL